MGDKMREEFEEYCLSDDGGYCKEHLEQDEKGNYTVVFELWEGWQASRAALCVELPKEDEIGRITYTSAMRAIHAAGVKTK